MDSLTREQRHRCMSNVKNKNTKPEILVRKFLFSQGYRFRLHRKDLPGKPDIVLPRFRTVIFVNGCFWHGHKNCRSSKLPETNKEFWTSKIASNIERDNQVRLELAQMGWRVIDIWQCKLKPRKIENTLKQLNATLRNE